MDRPSCNRHRDIRNQPNRIRCRCHIHRLGNYQLDNCHHQENRRLHSRQSRIRRLHSHQLHIRRLHSHQSHIRRLHIRRSHSHRLHSHQSHIRRMHIRLGRKRFRNHKQVVRNHTLGLHNLKLI